MDPSSSSSTSLVPYCSSKRKRDPGSYDEHHPCKRPRYDLFVNYSFEDTGNHFVSHFKTALKRNLFTIYDNNTLPTGQDESSELLKAIEDSHIYVVVISPKYPVSIKSLDELVLIMDSLSRFKDRKVFPVFLNVDPSDVRNIRGCFEEAFRTHEAKVDPERVYRWKQALKDAGQRSGLPIKNGDEADFIQEIVQQLKKIQLPLPLFDADHPVGIEPRAQAIISELRLGDQDFSNIVAVLGISGSGKTTVVKSMYDRIVAHFDYNCFIENIHFYKNSGPNWKVELQREVLRGLTGNDRFYNVGAAQIKKFITNNKALLVLDEVDKFEELQAIGIPSASLDSGSRIIVTTRNKRSLGNLPYTPYDIELLDFMESFELFVGHAYGEDDLVDEKFVDEIVDLAGGLPLVLEVWGRHFKAHERKLWGKLLETLKRIPHEDIQMKLRMSYDSLGERAKKLFLDIACFFDGWRTSVMLKVLEDQNASFFPEIELQVLLDRGLVTIEVEESTGDDVVVLHQVIREMGQEVVRRENEDEPGQRTRLIDQRDVLHVLENNSGTDSVRSIMLYTSHLKEQRIQVDTIEKMNNLRFIKFFGGKKCSYSSSSEDTSLSFKLVKYLEWEGFPWRRLNNDMGNVVVIKLLHSKLEILWEGYTNLKKLRILDVRRSKSLTRTGSFIGLENLEELNLSACFNLKEVDSTIVCLKKLKRMKLNKCKNLKSIPNLPEGIEEILALGCESLECLPSNMSDLQSLKVLDLNHCLDLRPESLVKVTRLRNLQELSMNYCNESHVPREIGNLVSLRELDLSNNRFSSLPDSFSNLSKLVELCINDCLQIQYLPLLPSNLGKITATGCHSLDVMPYDLMRMAYIFRSEMFKQSLFTRTLTIELSGKGITDWCSTTYKERGNVLSFEAPMYLDKKICGAILFSDLYPAMVKHRMLNKTKDTSHCFGTFTYNGYSKYISFHPLNDKTLVVEAGDTVELHFDRLDGLDKNILSCGLSLIYEGDAVDSALVIQRKNVAHEHTFPIPSEMTIAASISQLTDEVRSFSILDNGCVYYDFFS